MVLTHGTTLLSVRADLGIAGLTAGDGPFAVYLCSADLTLAELNEYLITNGPLTPSDITVGETASRGKYVRALGIISPSGDGQQAGLHIDNTALSGLRIPEDAGGYEFYLYNLGKSLTTGATCFIAASVFLRWDS